MSPKPAIWNDLHLLDHTYLSRLLPFRRTISRRDQPTPLDKPLRVQGSSDSEPNSTGHIEGNVLFETNINYLFNMKRATTKHDKFEAVHF